MSGGMSSGIKAMCTGTTFCDKQAMNASTMQKMPRRVPTWREIHATRTCIRPVCAMATAKVPRRM